MIDPSIPLDCITNPKLSSCCFSSVTTRGPPAKNWDGSVSIPKYQIRC